MHHMPSTQVRPWRFSLPVLERVPFRAGLIHVKKWQKTLKK